MNVELTKRDLFACQMMAGMIAAGSPHMITAMAELSVKCADALLEALVAAPAISLNARDYGGSRD